MLGPHMLVQYARQDGEDLIEVALGPPDDEEKAAKAATRWFADNRVRLYMGRIYPVSESEERDWFRQQAGADDTMQWCIYVDDFLIGMAGLSEINYSHSRAQFGIIIGERDYWGRGIGPVAGLAVLEYAFNNLSPGGLHKVITQAMTENQRSIRALQKMGFANFGVAREHFWFQGRWLDSAHMEIRKPEWQDRRIDMFRSTGITTLNLYPQTEIEGFEPIRPEQSKEDIQ